VPANHAHILVIDEAEEAEKLADLLRVRGFSCDTTSRQDEAEAWLKKGQFDCMVTELSFEGFSGLKLVREFQTKHPKLPIVMLTREQSSDIAIGAIQAGAYDCLLKPIDIEELNDVVKNAVEDARRMSKPVEIGEVYPDQDTIVGKSRAMRDIYKQLGRIAAQPVTVLILGETGTGKELIARAIYQHGHRAHKPFVAVNCASIPDALLESELFGHEKGAFTGADKMRVGRFEQAHGGTLFLDEIGDLNLALQAKMLRVLQEKTIQRVGANKDIPVDVRVIAATHRNLEKMVADGEFREDLIYRLNVAKVTIPPLRDRREDIPALIDYFLTRFATEYGIDSPSIAPKAVEFLQDQDWPGNIRQLQNVIRRALLASRGYTIGWHDCREILEDTEMGERESVPSFHQLVAETLSKVVEGELEAALPELTANFEREVYGQAIKRSGGNQAKAARWLGVSRLTLREKLRQYGLHPGDR
tara:strand:- start:34463 stop:35881 length:1419 start_codon:yes stop_codon:yes gene_type:complete